MSCERLIIIFLDRVLLLFPKKVTHYVLMSHRKKSSMETLPK